MMVSSMAAILPLTLTLEARPDVNVMAATMLFAIGSTLLFALGPALKLSRRDLVSDLKEVLQDATGIRRRFTGRNALVVTQIALSLTLLTSGGLFAGAALRAARSDPGFTYDRALLVSFDTEAAGMDKPRSRQAYRAVLSRVRAVPGVEAAGLASTIPFGDTREGRSVDTPGAAEEVRSADYRVISAGYFRALGLELRQGREFTESEEQNPDAPAVAIIDEGLAAALFPGRSPSGESIRFPAAPNSSRPRPALILQVVGVAPPVREELTQAAPRPHVYVPAGRHHQAAMHLHVKSAPGVDAAVLLATLRGEIRMADPALPVLNVTTLQAFHDRSLQLWALRTGGTMFVGLGVLALVLAVVGLYGVKSYVVANRTREIGIRMALGAHPGAVMRMVLRDGLALTLTGLAVGVPLAVGAALVLRSVFANLTGFDPLVMVGAPALLAAAALAASYLPARRATRVSPLTALRTQ
jgi:predicted permease